MHFTETKPSYARTPWCSALDGAQPPPAHVQHQRRQATARSERQLHVSGACSERAASGRLLERRPVGVDDYRARPAPTIAHACDSQTATLLLP